MNQKDWGTETVLLGSKEPLRAGAGGRAGRGEPPRARRHGHRAAAVGVAFAVVAIVWMSLSGGVGASSKPQPVAPTAGRGAAEGQGVKVEDRIREVRRAERKAEGVRIARDLRRLERRARRQNKAAQSKVPPGAGL